jgi:hypothetical protein
MPHAERIHVELNRLLAEIGSRRTAAARGDEGARAWIAGLDYWLSQYKAGSIGTELTITYELLPLFRDYSDVVEFEEGYGYAAALNAAGSAAYRP